MEQPKSVHPTKKVATNWTCPRSAVSLWWWPLASPPEWSSEFSSFCGTHDKWPFNGRCARIKNLQNTTNISNKYLFTLR